MSENNLVKIATYFNQFDAQLAKLKLEENDLYCFIKNENVAQLQIGWANYELMVNESDKETAMQILNEKEMD